MRTLYPLGNLSQIRLTVSLSLFCIITERNDALRVKVVSGSILKPQFQIGNLKPGLSNQEVQSRFTQANPITTVQGARLSGFQANDIIDYRTVYRTEILNHESFTFAPDPSVTARDFGLRIEPRQIHFRKN